MANGPSATETRQLRTLFAVGAAGMLTDGQLLERFATRDGDPAELAFAALVERHGSMVLRVARAVLTDEHSAHDAFQATFLILARKARSLWVRDSLGPWLHAVAFRVASHSRSAEAHRQRHERNASRLEAFEPCEWVQDELARAIHEEIDRLPQPYRLAVVTCQLEGLTQHDAAQRLGWPVGTLQSRLARGRQRLRDRLQRRGLAPSLAILAGKLPAVPPALLASTTKAAATLHLGRAVVGMIAPTVLAMIETTTKGMLMTKLKLGALALVMACGVVGSGIGLGVGRPVQATDGPAQSTGLIVPRPETEEDAGGKLLDFDLKPASVDDPEPVLTDLPNPRPWETTVLIRHAGGKIESIASGTIIKSTPDESIILTNAQGFQYEFVQGTYRGTIQVVLLRGPEGELAGAAGSPFNLVGEIVDLNPRLDLALIRIKPGRQLTSSPVVPPEWKSAKEAKLQSIDCSNFQNVTTHETTIAEPRYVLDDHDSNLITYDKPNQKMPTPPKAVMMKSARQSMPHFSGGGLFSTDGYVAGVFNIEVSDEGAGLYSTPESIRLMLDRNGLSSVYRGKKAESLNVELHGFKYPAPANLASPKQTTTANPATPESGPSPASTGPERRLADLEPKFPDSTTPKPWETAVRVRVITPDQPQGQQSGTVIHSTKEESLILTTAHGFDVFATVNGPKPKVLVDLFDGKIKGLDPVAVGKAEAGVEAEIRYYFREQDLALLRIRPGRVLPASPICDVSWTPKQGMVLYAAGSSLGEDATVSQAHLLDPDVKVVEARDKSKDPLRRRVMSCGHSYDPGRMGGGLFTTDGDLAGVFLNQGEADQHGLYARVDAIWALLSGYEQGLENSRLFAPVDKPNPLSKYRHPASPRSKAEPTTAATEPAVDRRVSDQDRRLNDLERKLDQVLQALSDLKGEKPPELFKGDFPVRKR